MEFNNRVSLKIGPMTLNLITSDSEEYAQSLARKLDGQLNEMMNTNQNLTLAQGLAMIALQAIDKAKNATDAADNMRSKLKVYIEENSDLRLKKERAEQNLKALRQELAEYKK